MTDYGGISGSAVYVMTLDQTLDLGWLSDMRHILIWI